MTTHDFNGIALPSKAERYKIRATFSKWNKVWNRSGINRPAKVGKMMELVSDIDPASEHEFLEGYVSHPQGRTAKTLGKYAQEFSDFTNGELSPSEALGHIYIHLFTETFEGYDRENQIIDLLNARGRMEATRAPYSIDNSYGIDIITREYDKDYTDTPLGFTIGVQVKPSSFWLGGWAAQKLQQMERYEKNFAPLGLDVWYMDADKTLSTGEPVAHHYTAVKRHLQAQA